MQVSLETDGWHRRLQLWMFRDAPRFNNLCPYFWFTVFCTVAAPFVFACKAFLFLADKNYDILVWLASYLLTPFSFADKWLGKRFNPDKEWRTNKFIRNLSDEMVYYYWKVARDFKKRSEGFFTYYPHEWEINGTNAFEAWKKHFPDWENRLNGIISRQKELEEKRVLARKEAEERAILLAEQRQERYMKLAVWTQKIGKPLGVLLAGLLGLSLLVGTGFGIYWLLANYFTWVIGVIVFALTVMVVMALVKVIVEWLAEHNWLGAGILFSYEINYRYILTSWLGTCFKIALKPFGIFFFYVKAFLDSSCPAIDWKEPVDG